MTWIASMRLRVLAVAVGILLAAVGVISLTTIPAWPIVGAFVAAVAVFINTSAARLSAPTCHGCGRDIADLPAGEHGVVCPDCGSISRKPDQLA